MGEVKRGSVGKGLKNGEGIAHQHLSILWKWHAWLYFIAHRLSREQGDDVIPHAYGDEN